MLSGLLPSNLLVRFPGISAAGQAYPHALKLVCCFLRQPVQENQAQRVRGCQRMVREQGGQQVNGWAIWQWKNILVKAGAYAVRESLEDKKRCGFQIAANLARKWFR